MTARRSAALLLFSALACGRTDIYGAGVGGSGAPVVTFDPPAQVFAGSISVMVETDVPATLRYTLDGSDPRVAGPAVFSANSPKVIALEETALVTVQATGKDGLLSEVVSSFYERGGPAAGSIAGEVIVGGDAVGKRVAISYFSGGTTTSVQIVERAPQGPVPFKIEGLAGGTYVLRAIADTNSDGDFSRFFDLASDVTTVTLQLDDPRRAGVEGLKIYLGRSEPGLATLYGVIHVPAPENGRPLSLLLLDASALLGGGLGASFDPTTLLSMLGRPPWSDITRANQTDYPYRIFNITPGTYLPMPLLGALGLSGAHLTFLVNISPFGNGGPVRLGADSEVRRDFFFGPATVSGTVTKETAPPGFGLGVVAFKPADFTLDLQLSVGLTFLVSNDTGGRSGGFRIEAQREGAYAARLFTSDGGTEPITAALAWLANPLSSAGGQVIDVQADTVTDLVFP